ncbi:MAG: hypothetical protein DRP64_15815 [Verrucomicrobia bacterium]|nr:MAG: hypothetical protein DRP64_15815 [Verrucomicrobiota bacterium]
MKILSAVFCMAILVGCSSVTMKEPFPGSQLTEKEQNQLTGTWQLDESVVHVAFTSNGVPWLAAVEWQDNDFVLNKSRLYFTKHNDALYVCMPTESDETSEYLFAEIKPAGKGINAWGPDAAYFGKLVESGTLKGSVERDEHSTSVKLETPAVEILELIATNHAAIDYKTPLLFRKLD